LYRRIKFGGVSVALAEKKSATYMTRFPKVLSSPIYASRCGRLMKNLLVASLLLATLPSCALLRSQVAVVHQFPKDVSGTTHVMIPFKEQEGPFQHKAYEEAIRQELNAKGFRETTIDQAQTVVFFAYGIGTGRGVASSYPIIGKPE